MSAALPGTQVLDIAKRCGVKGSDAALVEFATLVREAEPLAVGDVFGKTEILHPPGGQVDPCMALPHVRTSVPAAAARAAERIDMAALLDKLARVGRWIDKFPVPTDGATAMLCRIRDVQEALARATPQHSVTEQALEAIAQSWDECVCPGIGDDRPIGAILREQFAQPLASTAATQPEQASGVSLDAILNCYSPDDTVRDYQDKIRALFAALTIPASTAASDPMGDGWHSLTCDGTCKPLCAAAGEQQAGADELPALPHTTYNGYSDGSEPLWTKEQMHEYARAALTHRATTAPK